MAVESGSNREVTQKIENLLAEIMLRAAKTNDKEICDKVDKYMVLLPGLGGA